MTGSRGVETGPVAIVGVGLMGGSLGLALQRRAGVRVVRGTDPDPEALRAGLARGAITEAAGSLEEAAAGAMAVFLAAPVGRLGELARRALAASGHGCLVSDVGSTKSGIVGGLGAEERERFIGGHPVCGAERGGVAFAREDLFEDATYFLTPSPEARPALFERLHHLVSALGARAVAIDPDVHDRLMALVSHLPHAIAAALIHQAADTAPAGREALRSAGPSFTDLTRVAGANPPLWADIFLANRVALGEALRDQAARLGEVERALAGGDREWLLRFIEGAAAGRERLRRAQAAPVEAPWRLVVGVPNRPGAISEIAMALGHAHINIEDLALRPGEDGAAGELSLLVSGEATAREAARLVASRGYAAEVAPAG
ncbi:MAG: prephenate dehydrogenase [Miltoncostaeaceae bacterium]|nr:prephenate dehydrogenase [Miltoncostaeaceae bacterium]